MQEPPVQPDYHVVPVTIILSPTRNRHEKSPLAVAIGNLELVDLDIESLEVVA